MTTAPPEVVLGLRAINHGMRLMATSLPGEQQFEDGLAIITSCPDQVMVVTSFLYVLSHTATRIEPADGGPQTADAILLDLIDGGYSSLIQTLIDKSLAELMKEQT